MDCAALARAKARAEKPNARNFNRAELLHILRAHRAPDALAHALAEAAEKSRADGHDAGARLRTRQAHEDRAARHRQIAGHSCWRARTARAKPAVAAKIAAHARLAGRAVKLIATDTDGAGAVARLETFADHLGVPSRRCGDRRSAGAASSPRTREGQRARHHRHRRFRSAQCARPHRFRGACQDRGCRSHRRRFRLGDAEEIAETLPHRWCRSARSASSSPGSIFRAALGALAPAATRSAAARPCHALAFVAGGLETLTPLSLARASDRSTPDRGSAQ